MQEKKKGAPKDFNEVTKLFAEAFDDPDAVRAAERKITTVVTHLFSFSKYRSTRPSPGLVAHSLYFVMALTLMAHNLVIVPCTLTQHCTLLTHLRLHLGFSLLRLDSNPKWHDLLIMPLHTLLRLVYILENRTTCRYKAVRLSGINTGLSKRGIPSLLYLINLTSTKCEH